MGYQPFAGFLMPENILLDCNNFFIENNDMLIPVILINPKLGGEADSYISQR